MLPSFIVPPFVASRHTTGGLTPVNPCTVVAAARRVRGRLLALGVLLWCLPLFTACSHSATGPQGIDPSILLTNLSDDSAYVTWASDAGLSTVVVPPRSADVCTRWVQSFDSLYVQVRAGSATATTPWLHFADYPYYFQVDTVRGTGPAYVGGSAIQITNGLAAAEC